MRSRSNARILAVLSGLPMPMAQLGERALIQNGAPLHSAAYFLVESGLKLVAAYRFALLRRGASALPPKVAAVVRELALPSYGHFVQLLRHSVDATNASAIFKKSPEAWSKVTELAAILRSELPELTVHSGHTGGGILGFLELVGMYRNRAIAHSAQHAEPYYERVGDALFAAALEVFGGPEVFDGRALAIPRYRTDATGLRADLEWLDLTGFARCPLEADATAEAGELCFVGPKDAVSLIPLVIGSQDGAGTAHIEFLNRVKFRAQGPLEASMLDYVTARSRADETASTAFADLLSAAGGPADRASPAEESQPASQAFTLLDVSRVTFEHESSPRAEELSRAAMVELLRLRDDVDHALRARFGRRLAILVLRFEPEGGRASVGDAAAQALSGASRVVVEHGGRPFGAPGADPPGGSFADLASALRALASIQAEVLALNLVRTRREQLGIRAAIHVGEVFDDGSQLDGEVIVRTRALVDVAAPNEVVLTEGAFEVLGSDARGRWSCLEQRASQHTPGRIHAATAFDPAVFPSHVEFVDSGDLHPLPALHSITFGRVAEGTDANDVVLRAPDESKAARISRWHFELRRTARGFMLRNTGRATEVDGKLLADNAEALLHRGSVVRVGGAMSLRFITPTSSAPAVVTLLAPNADIFRADD